MADLKTLARDLRTFARKDLIDVSNSANFKTSREAKDLAVFASQGPFKSPELAARDHPYATRHGEPGLDPSIINEQTGVFARSWTVQVRYAFGGKSYVLLNTASYATFLEHGTRFMFARPIQDRIEKHIEIVGPINFQAAFAPAFRRRFGGS